MKLATHSTPIDWGAVPRLLDEQFADIYGVKPERALPYLMAMIAIENARGRSINNFNWGNITTSDPDDDYWLAPGNDRLFSAFTSHDDGVRAYLRRLGSPTHSRILRAAMLDDFRSFFDAITLPHPKTKMAYCPDCRTQAAADSYYSLVNEFKGALGQLTNTTRATVQEKKKNRRSGGGAVALLALGAAGLGLGLWHIKKRR